MILPCLLAITVLTKGNLLCDDNKGTQLPTTVKLTCDELMKVYVDGKQISKEKTGYKTAGEFKVPFGSNLLAISCEHVTKVPRILGEIGNITVTGSQGWICTDQYHSRWNTVGFVDSLWSPAVSYVKNEDGKVPYGKIGNISSEAEWIGAGDKVAESRTLYCRFTLCPKQKCTSFSATRIDNHKLYGHVFSVIAGKSLIECALMCAGHNDRCESFNYSADKGKSSCELNNSTHITELRSLKPTVGVIYWHKLN